MADRHGIVPSKALGQHFLIDPNLARAIASDAGVGTGDRVLEIGAGLGSLTVALAGTGAEVLAVEFDRALLPALREVVASRPTVRVVAEDALHADWPALLGGEAWTAAANLPYNIAVPVVLRLVEEVPSVVRLVVMVQREVAERFVAGPGDTHYGPSSLRVAYRCTGAIVRPVPPSVFWPRPRVGSAVVRLDRRSRPAVDVEEASLWRVVDAAFAERRKTIRTALVRLGLSRAEADAELGAAGVDPSARGERLSLDEFAAIARAVA
ncbi:MAG TPA: 16S rRNA (adenine(1518)-N(6)/adenine(1519)-N(6))-dimethyltransferase RsmA [Actinomycetota bacterium]